MPTLERSWEAGVQRERLGVRCTWIESRVLSFCSLETWHRLGNFSEPVFSSVEQAQNWGKLKS